MPRKRAQVALFLLVGLSLAAIALQANPSGKPILEVINKHFSWGWEATSVYLRVYSDGRTECHARDKRGIVKRKTLGPEELQGLQAVLDDPELLEKEKHGPMHLVLDSRVEWDIRVHHGRHSENIKVLNFSPESARKVNQPYPPALLKLGCSIWKLRNEVYGDEPEQGEPFYRGDDCKSAQGIQ